MKLETAIKKINESTFKRNEKFVKASPAIKRVMVLQDALLMLRRRKFTATHGVYFRLQTTEIEEGGRSLGTSELFCKLDDSTQLSSVLALPTVKCSVCAIGGAFASLIRLKDKANLFDVNISIDGAGKWAGFAHYLEKSFPQHLLRMMESAFEHNGYGYRARTSRELLRLIYKNIIRNKGERFTSHAEAKFIYDEKLGYHPKGTILWSQHRKEMP